MRRPDSDRASSQRTTPRAGRGAQGIGERYIAGVPARIMRPRLVFLTCLFSLVCFGLLMVYSASSVEALHENGSATYFLFRQFIFTVIGVAALEFIARIAPDSWFEEGALKLALGAMVILLFAVFLFGSGSFSELGQTSRVYWLGGALGLVITLSVMLSVKGLGPTAAVSVILITQLLTAAVIDAFGLLGTEKAAFAWNKYAGLGLMTGGMLLFKWR